MTDPITDLFADLSKVASLTAAHARIEELERENAELRADRDRFEDQAQKLARRLQKVRQTIRRMEEGEL